MKTTSPQKPATIGRLLRKSFGTALMLFGGFGVIANLEGPGSVIKSPVMREMNAIHAICGKLRDFRPNDASVDLKGKSVDGLVVLKAISASDAEYLHSNNVVFYGYDHDDSSDDTPLFIALSWTSPAGIAKIFEPDIARVVFCIRDGSSTYCLIADAPETLKRHLGNQAGF